MKIIELHEGIGSFIRILSNISKNLSFAKQLSERQRAIEKIKSSLAQVESDDIDNVFQEWLRLTRSVDETDPRNKDLVANLEDIGQLISQRTDQIRRNNNIQLVLDGKIPYMLDSSTGKIVARPIQFWPSWAREAWQEIVDTKGEQEAERILAMIMKKIQNKGPK